MEAIYNIRDDPEYFECRCMHVCMQRVECVQRHQKAQQINKRIGSGTISYVEWGIWYFCYRCDEAEKIHQSCRDLRLLPPKPKPGLKTIKPKPPQIKPKKRRVAAYQAIDWASLMQTDNGRTGFHFSRVRRWLESLYKRYNQNMTATAKYIGTSPDTLRRKFNQLHLHIRGKEESGTAKFLAIPATEMSRMTRLQISLATGLCVSTVATLCERYGRTYTYETSYRGNGK